MSGARRLGLTLGAALALLLGAPPAAAHPVWPGVAPEAVRYRRLLVGEVRRVWGLAQSPAPFFGQVHQESRFRAGAESPAGALGLAQFMPGTAAWVQGLYAADLRPLCEAQGGCPRSPAWALRALVLWDRRLWLGAGWARGDEDRMAVMLAGYNGGEGWITRERRACAARPGCDPDRWWGQLEGVCLRAAWACRENRDYPRLILRHWAPRYARWLTPWAAR